jgi:hypothetical protein
VRKSFHSFPASPENSPVVRLLPTCSSPCNIDTDISRQVAGVTVATSQTADSNQLKVGGLAGMVHK